MIHKMSEKTKYNIQLERVETMSRELKPGILYVSDRFQVAAHLCPCGCGNKVITPLGLTEWKFTMKNNKPSLYPSIGNWQFPCRSHYWITEGIIEWSGQWSEKQIKAGRKAEMKRRREYYQGQKSKRKKLKLRSFIERFLKRKPKKCDAMDNN